MYLFYIEQLTGKTATLSAEEAKHCSKVLRKNVGDTITATDGAGLHYELKINAITHNHLEAEVMRSWVPQTELPYPTTLVFPFLKTKDRTEWMIEKAVELGVTHFQPAIYDRTEGYAISEDRLLRIITAGLKQCLRAQLPVLLKPLPLKTVIKQNAAKPSLIAWCNSTVPLSTTHLCKDSELVIYIGPEGDFSDNEIDTANEFQIPTISLGATRLRTETAAIHLLSLRKSVFI